MVAGRLRYCTECNINRQRHSLTLRGRQRLSLLKSHISRNSTVALASLSTLAGSRKMPSLSLHDTLPLPKSSVHIPRLGFGVYRSSPSVCVQSCLTALEVGYRHIDTAQFYGNETQVGEAVQKSGIPRSEVFVTTKILSAAGSVEKSYQKCLDSVEKIHPGGYVDLFLVHSPNAGSKARKEMWLALEKLYEEGKAKSIGVSNYGVGHIEEMKTYAKVWPPHVNQIEVCFAADHSLLCGLRWWLVVQATLPANCKIQGTQADESSSFILGVSSARLPPTARNTALSSKPTRRSSATTKPMTQRWSPWRRNTTSQLLKY